MNIKSELLKSYITDLVSISINELVNPTEIADTLAIKILSEIKEVIGNESLSDFEVVEEITCILEKYNISTNGRHDF